MNLSPCPVALNLLHFSYGFGNTIGPTATKIFPIQNITNSTYKYNCSGDFSELTTSDTGVYFKECYDRIWTYPLTQTYTLVAGCIFIFGISHLFNSCSALRNDESSHENWEPKIFDDKFTFINLTFKCSTLIALGLANGINFGYSNFITKFMIDQFGSDFGPGLTSIFFASSTLFRLITSCILFCNSSALKWLFLSDFIFLLLSCGTGMFYLFGSSTIWTFGVTTVFAALGQSTIFPVGIEWVKTHCNLTPFWITLYILATSAGAQAFRVPVTVRFDTDINILLYTLFGVVALMVMLMAVAIWMLRHVQSRKMVNEEVFDDVFVENNEERVQLNFNETRI